MVQWWTRSGVLSPRWPKVFPGAFHLHIQALRGQIRSKAWYQVRNVTSKREECWQEICSLNCLFQKIAQLRLQRRISCEWSNRGISRLDSVPECRRRGKIEKEPTCTNYEKGWGREKLIRFLVNSGSVCQETLVNTQKKVNTQIMTNHEEKEEKNHPTHITCFRSPSLEANEIHVIGLSKMMIGRATKHWKHTKLLEARVTHWLRMSRRRNLDILLWSEAADMMKKLVGFASVRTSVELNSMSWTESVVGNLWGDLFNIDRR